MKRGLEVEPVGLVLDFREEEEEPVAYRKKLPKEFWSKRRKKNIFHS